MTELKMLAAILAGSRLTHSEARGYELLIKHEFLTGEDVQTIAARLLEKGLVRKSGGMFLVASKGRDALANMDVDPTEYFYDDPDYSVEIYVGTAFLCRICGDGFADKDMTQAHIDTEHGEDNNHNDPDEDDEDSEDSDADDLAEPASGMDRPYNFDELAEA